MAAIITQMETEPTGPYAHLLPILLHGAGIGGYDHRYVAQTLAGNPGDPVTAWEDTKGGEPLTVKVGTPVLAVDAGIKGVQFDNAMLGRTAFSTPQRTIAVVMRLTAADSVNSGILAGTIGNPHPGLIRTSGNAVGMFSPSGVGVTHAPSNASIKAWCVAFMRLGATATSRINAGGYELTAASNGAGFSGLEIGRSGGVFGRVIVAEILTWPTELVLGDLVTIQAAMHRHYPAVAA